MPKNIELALPTKSPARNALTVIAGRNRTGKSHLLRHTDAALRAHNDSLGQPGYVKEMGASSSNVWIRPLDPSAKFDKWFSINNMGDFVAGFAQFPAFPTAADKGHIHRTIADAKLAFIRKQFTQGDSLTCQFAELALPNLANAWDLESTRAQMLERLDPATMYRADPTVCPAIRVFESLASARVYFRFNDKLRGVEPVLRYGPSEAFSFGGRTGGWSQGQKVAFCIFLMIEYGRPSILLVDELENHLHPEYMSTVCVFIKERVPQTLVVTHHPHLIFSASVDRVWFLEVDVPDDDAPLVDKFPEKISSTRPPPRRRIIALDSDYERIAATYSLFDSYDRQLLNLATSLHEQLTTELLENIEAGLTLEVASASTTNRPDTQSRELHDVVFSLFRDAERPIGILDYGAGKGRTLAEFLKTTLFQNITTSWTFYEPNPTVAAELRSKYSASPNDTIDCIAVIQSSLHDVADASFDVILAVNLLHECSPHQIATVLDACRRLLRPKGKVLVAELYPLLSPERFGLSYAPTEMIDILRVCGFAGFSVPLPIRSGLVTAYTCVAGPQGNAPSTEQSTKQIREIVWQPIKNRALWEYAASMELVSARNAIKLASQLHVIASIDAYDAGLWPST